MVVDKTTKRLMVCGTILCVIGALIHALINTFA